MNLRERCRMFLSLSYMRDVQHIGSPVDDLLAFILAERGRGADDGEEAK